jgi:hypothetical protein
LFVVRQFIQRFLKFIVDDPDERMRSGSQESSIDLEHKWLGDSGSYDLYDFARLDASSAMQSKIDEHISITLEEELRGSEHGIW